MSDINNVPKIIVVKNIAAYRAKIKKQEKSQQNLTKIYKAEDNNKKDHKSN